jgi:V8-like Glu-specific endopeptidase
MLVTAALVTGAGMARAGRQVHAARHTPVKGGVAHPASRVAVSWQGAYHGVVPAVSGSRVGPIFSSDDPSDHHCTGSVVGRDLIVTAAHCSTDGGWFAPGFRKDGYPYGLWRLGERLVDDAWRSSRDEDHDVAFIQIKPLRGWHIGDVVGYNPVAFDRGFGVHVTVIGYPTGESTPVSGSARTLRYSATQMRVNIPGMAAGTSGAPWIDGAGEVIGVIGGHDEGGTEDDVSYSVYFGRTVQALLSTADPQAR